MISKIKNLVAKITLSFCSIFSYIPIILGILIPMATIMGGYLYLSWFFFGYNFTSWTWYYYIISEEIIPYLIAIEIIIIGIGLGIFLTGLVTLVIGKKREENIIQWGIYKYIRHPQNLGILIMVFPFALYIPGFEDIGIRVGEIVSWSLFAFFLCLLSFYEEWRLMKENNNEFLKYYASTGFFLPKFKYVKDQSPTPINFLKKIIILCIGFIVLVSIYYLIVQFFLDELVAYR